MGFFFLTGSSIGIVIFSSQNYQKHRESVRQIAIFTSLLISHTARRMMCLCNDSLVMQNKLVDFRLRDVRVRCVIDKLAPFMSDGIELHLVFTNIQLDGKVSAIGYGREKKNTQITYIEGFSLISIFIFRV